jgi:hypothetical protein
VDAFTPFELDELPAPYEFTLELLLEPSLLLLALLLRSLFERSCLGSAGSRCSRELGVSQHLARTLYTLANSALTMPLRRLFILHQSARRSCSPVEAAREFWVDGLAGILSSSDSCCSCSCYRICSCEYTCHRTRFCWQVA